MSRRMHSGAPIEMNVRRAHQLKARLQMECRLDDFEVWAIAQGLAYIHVRRPYGTAVVELVLHDEREVAEFIDREHARRNREAEAFAADKERNGDDSFRIE